MLSLTDKATIYIPSSDASGEPLATDKRQDVLDYVLAQFSARYGGATAQNAIGSWINDKGSLVKESVTLVFAFAQQVVLDDIVALAQHVKDILTQESVAFEVNSTLYLL